MGFSSSLPAELLGIPSAESDLPPRRENKGPPETVWGSQGPPNATG